MVNSIRTNLGLIAARRGADRIRLADHRRFEKRLGESLIAKHSAFSAFVTKERAHSASGTSGKYPSK
jgi:hypothetical protein